MSGAWWTGHTKFGRDQSLLEPKRWWYTSHVWINCILIKTSWKLIHLLRSIRMKNPQAPIYMGAVIPGSSIQGYSLMNLTAFNHSLQNIISEVSSNHFLELQHMNLQKAQAQQVCKYTLVEKTGTLTRFGCLWFWAVLLKEIGLMEK